MLRVHLWGETPKYTSGKWSWDKKRERFHFEPHQDLEDINDEVLNINDFKFNKTLKHEEELIFRQEFVRAETTFDSDVILVSDILNLVLFLMPSEFLTKRFIEIMHTKEVHNFLHALIIYFEHYLKYVEFVLIRRDEIIGDAAQTQSGETVQVKRVFANYLSQYRMLVAREYSIIVLGKGSMSKFYHLKPIVNISATLLDRYFFEQFLAVTTQIVWIAMRRRCYDEINSEMSRLFRSDHFMRARPEPANCSQADKRLLCGRNCKNKNYRFQNSPVVQELINVQLCDQPILWIGDRKYRGTNRRIHELELEYIIPESQLSLVDISHGILGHPKILYNTLLQLNWNKVRYKNYNELDDPYRIIRQQRFALPSIEEETFHKHAKHLQHYYELKKCFESTSKAIIAKWLRRDSIVNYYKTEGFITNITMKCQQNIDDVTYGIGRTVNEIVERFRNVELKLRKK